MAENKIDKLSIARIIVIYSCCIDFLALLLVLYIFYLLKTIIKTNFVDSKNDSLLYFQTWYNYIVKRMLRLSNIDAI